MLPHQPIRIDRSTGFSLIELLVVIAILSVLLSFLVPSSRRATEAAEEVICKANLREQGKGVISYGTETGFLPPSYTREFGILFAVWPTLIRQHVGTGTDMFNCPTAPDDAHWKQKFGSGLAPKWGYENDEIRLQSGGRGSWKFSYGHNNDGTHAGSYPTIGMGDPWNMARVSAVVSPPSFMMIADSMIDGVWDHFIDEDVPGEEPAQRHRGGAYVLLGDGHVDFIIPGPYLDHGNTGANDPDLRRRWNLDDQPH